MRFRTLTVKAAKAAYANGEIQRPFFLNNGLYFTYIAGPNRGEDGYIVTTTGTFKQYLTSIAAGDELVKITGEPLDRYSP